MLYDLPFFPTSVDNGKDGKDGISPTIAVSDIAGGHRLTIVDINGSKTIDVMDGETGLEGKQGPAGQNGTSTVITKATATIDNTSGTPEVKVTLGGTDLERTFAFAFTGLKGIKGDTGSQGIQGERGETGERGLQGVQGEAGKDGNDGVGIKSTAINDLGELVVTYTNNNEVNLGKVVGEGGAAGTNGTNGKSAYEYAKDGGYTESEQVFAEMLANALDKRKITLGIHTDNLLYLFIDGQPIGTGIEQNISVR